MGLGGFGRGARLELRRTRVTETRHVTRAHGHGRVSLEMNDVYRLDSGYESRGGARAPARRFIIRRAYTRCVRDMILCLVSVVARGHAHGDESGEERAQCMRVPFINLQDTRDALRSTPRPQPPNQGRAGSLSLSPSGCVWRALAHGHPISFAAMSGAGAPLSSAWSAPSARPSRPGCRAVGRRAQAWRQHPHCLQLRLVCARH